MRLRPTLHALSLTLTFALGAGAMTLAPQAQARDFTLLNAELARQWKPITRTKPALPDADAWSKVHDKLGELKR